MFHVKHFGTIQTAGNEPRLVGLRGLFPSHTSPNLTLFAEKGGERGASFLRPHGGGKQPRLFLDPGENFLSVAAHEAARRGNRRAGFCREPRCLRDCKTAQLARRNDGIGKPEPHRLPSAKTFPEQ